MGYPVLFDFLQRRSGAKLTWRIDKNDFDESQLIELKVPLDMPYTTTWSEYERLEGEITINGQHHNFVKRKVSGDTLYLLCIPNIQKDKLVVSEKEYGKNVNDFDGSEKNETAKKENIQLQYLDNLQEYLFASIDAANNKPTSFINTITPQFYLDNPGKPPQINS